MKKIFVVDDEKRIRDLIELYLKKEGYDVYVFEGSSGVVQKVEEASPDLLVLDIMMPEMDGLDLCRAIRKISDIPIIFVSARSEEFDRILGLELGADDYLAKPFSVRELIVRIKTILKRTTRSRQIEDDREEVIRLSDFELNPKRRLAKVKGEVVSLTLKEFDVLHFLLKNVNIPLSREQIIEAVWGYDYDGYDRNVDDTVKRLRRKLGDADSDLQIKTVWGFGYRVDQDH